MSLPIIANASEVEEIVSQTTKYYKTIYNNYGYTLYSDNNSNCVTIEISEEEYNNSNLYLPLKNPTTYETALKKITTTIYKSNSRYRYETTVTWKDQGRPQVRSYDVLGISFYPSVEVDGDISFTNKYCTSSSCYEKNNYKGKTNAYGVSATFKLDTGTFSTISATLSFYVKKSTEYTVTSQRAIGHYVHATSSVTEANAYNHSINMDKGIVFSDTSSYDISSKATATWSGSW